MHIGCGSYEELEPMSVGRKRTEMHTRWLVEMGERGQVINGLEQRGIPQGRQIVFRVFNVLLVGINRVFLEDIRLVLV